MTCKELQKAKPQPIANQSETAITAGIIADRIALIADISNIVRVGGYLSMDGRVCKSRFDDGPAHGKKSKQN